MGCLHADVRLANCFCSRVNNANELEVSYTVIQKPSVKIKLMVSAVSDFEANVDYKKALLLAQASCCNVPIFVKLDPVCQFVPSYYLEIEPEMIWVYPDWEVGMNIFSNTEWYIN